MTTALKTPAPRIGDGHGLTIDVSKLSPENAVARLIAHAIAINASDLFFAGALQGVVVKVRQLGIIRLISVIGGDLGRRCVSHIKASANMEWTEKRRPLDGRWIFDIGDGVPYDLRIGAIPTLYGEDLAIRLLSRDPKRFTLENLGMTSDQMTIYKAMIDSPSGLIIIAGPTGSGKTATLYASLARLNTGTRKINTIEDPVEFGMDGIHQTQVNPAIDLGFFQVLRGVLRQNPDIIMIGEIRDPETAQLAVHAAATGMMVFATLHAQTGAGAIHSMRSLGAHPHFLAATLRGVVAQRLVRTLCPACRTAFDLGESSHTFDDVRRWLAPDEGRTLYGAQGCEKCGMSGYASRSGVFEMMQANPAIRDLIAESKPIRELRKVAAEGMLTFRQAALLKVARGETTTEEVFRVVPSEDLEVDPA